MLSKGLRLKGDDDLTFRMHEDALQIQHRHQALLKAQAIVRKHVSASRSLSNELTAERRTEATREAEPLS